MVDVLEALPMVPLTSGVVLPHMVFTMALESDEARAAIDAASTSGNRVILVPVLDGHYSSIGVLAEVVEAGELPGAGPGVAVHAIERVRIGAAVPGTGQALWVQFEVLSSQPASAAAQELAREYRAVLENILLTRGARRFAERLRDLTDPSEIADLSGYSQDLSLEQKLEVLETVDVEARLRLVLGWAREVLADLALRERIKTDVEEGMERNQREFLLRRQLDAIRRELSELSDSPTDDNPDDYRQKIATMDLPDGVRKAVERELDKLERTSDQNPEQGWIRTWIDTVLEIPFGVISQAEVDLEQAGRSLDNDHYGLEDVKERLLEHLAVLQRQRERGLAPVKGAGGAILALVGPPGVGKTSLGESVARALGRKFARVALGGVRDEAEIRGHRRTYVGAQPGRIVRAIREAGSMDPVLMLDEVDKIGADYRGDPSSALLEVLDPAQNHTFRDHYLEIELDLSKVLFIATANVLETIPLPLLDRMEIIRLDGYTEEEKVAIARRHLLPRQLERAALESDEFIITDDALRRIISDYTREAGVRSVEREIGRLARKVAMKISAASATSITVDGEDVREWLGRPRFFFEAADRTAVPGVATGLAVTGVGGDVLFVEASVMDGAEGLTLTGQLGEVMRESAEIALSYVRSHASELGVDPKAFTGRRFHVHVPAGAVPKDGPSAGVTMTSAIVSLLTGRPVDPKVAMTGEVTLQGRVLPIGGVKQKVLAAHRAGLSDVILPKRNGPDIEDVPESVRNEMHFHLAEDIAEVLAVALRDGEEASSSHDQAA